MTCVPLLKMFLATFHTRLHQCERRPDSSGAARALRNHLFQPPLSSRTRRGAARQRKERTMLGWALTFLVVALVAAVLGFGGIAGLSIEIARIIFFVAIVLFLISAVVGLLRGRSPTTM
jgi:uncharacterized membrane protein YtjA (UPF0391 family)